MLNRKPRSEYWWARTFWLTIFAVSGAASLSYQVVWQRILTQEIGVDSISVTLIIGIFMLGLGLGSLLGSKALAKRPRLIPLLAFLEVFIGFFGFLSENLIRDVNRSLLQGSNLTIQIIVNFFLLLLPTLAMGASTPIMVQIFRDVAGGPRNVGTAYSANIFGAALGILAFGLIGIGAFGLTKSLHLIAFFDFLIAVLILLKGHSLPLRQFEKKAASSLANSDKAIFKVYMAVFLIGFAALGLEVVLFRLLTSYFGVIPYVFPLMLFAYLINMGFGTYLGGKLSGKLDSEFDLTGKHLKAIFIYLSFSLVPILFLPKILFHFGNLVPSFSQASLIFVFDSAKNGFDSNFVRILIAMGMSVILLAPIAIISAILPWVVNSMNETKLEGAIFGKLYFIQTLGNTIGSITTGFILYRFTTTTHVVVILITLCYVGLLLLIQFFRMKKSIVFRKLELVSVVLSLSLIITSDFYNDIRYFRSQTDAVSPVWIKESIHGATLVYDAFGDQKIFRVTSGGRFHVTTLPGAIDPNSKDGITEPLIYGINGKVKSILFIGLGTATELLRFRKLYPNCRITIIEINPDVVEAFQKFAPESLLNEIESGNLYIGDGRRYLQSNPTARFDLVHIGVHRASTTGAGNLFSKDFLTLVRTHLNPHGIVSFYSYPTVVKAAMDVFGDVVVFANVGSIGHAFATTARNGIISSEFWERYEIAQTKVGGQLEISNHNANIEGASVYYPYESLRVILSKMNESSDNMIVTEYYLNNRTEIVPGLYKSGNPVDYRIWPISNLALPFSPEKIFEKSRILSGQYSLSADEIASGLQMIPNYPSFLPGEFTSNVKVNFGFFPKVNELFSKGHGFQWDFKVIPLPIDGTWEAKITCEKKGRGIWGLKFNLLTENHSNVIDLGTRNSEKTTLAVAFKVGAKVEKIIPSITLDDADSVFPGKSLLKCYDFRIEKY